MKAEAEVISEEADEVVVETAAAEENYREKLMPVNVTSDTKQSDTKPEAESAAAEVAAVKEMVASMLPKAVKTPEEQKKADELAKQAAFRAALAAATHPNRPFFR